MSKVFKLNGLVTFIQNWSVILTLLLVQTAVFGQNHLRPAFSFDGKHIAYLSDENGPFQLFVANSEGSKPVNITPSSANISIFKWSPKDNRILYLTENELRFPGVPGLM